MLIYLDLCVTTVLFSIKHEKVTKLLLWTVPANEDLILLNNQYQCKEGRSQRTIKPKNKIFAVRKSYQGLSKSKIKFCYPCNSLG